LPGLFSNKLIHDQSSDSIAAINGPIFDRHQEGICQILQTAFLNQPLNNKAGDLLSSWW